MADSMLDIYLDQKDRIALLKAEAGKPERPAHADALTLLRAALDAGSVSLPLSHVHYQETSHRRKYATAHPPRGGGVAGGVSRIPSVRNAR